MKDKKQDEISLEELVKAANAIRDFFTKLGDELSKVLANIKVFKEDTWEMKCPYEFGDEYWNIIWGKVRKNTWDCIDCERTSFEAGEIFPTQQEAELELKRRNLLTRFRAFRDECNGDWKADWMDYLENKFLVCIVGSELEVNSVYAANDFVLFGYFKNPKDVERAIELFGDEIKELFVEGE
jgi:hypothetical protein|nr:MAG TPA: hypothetical protein [Caudoviricetes sp.]